MTVAQLWLIRDNYIRVRSFRGGSWQLPFMFIPDSEHLPSAVTSDAHCSARGSKDENDAGQQVLCACLPPCILSTARLQSQDDCASAATHSLLLLTISLPCSAMPHLRCDHSLVACHSDRMSHTVIQRFEGSAAARSSSSGGSSISWIKTDVTQRTKDLAKGTIRHPGSSHVRQP
jgi:hypothetical protein